MRTRRRGVVFEERFSGKVVWFRFCIESAYIEFPQMLHRYFMQVVYPQILCPIAMSH
jgi:hypothetical protein